MKRVIYTLIFLIISTTNCFSQDMQKGFTYLETGKYPEAEEFFIKSIQLSKESRSE